MKNLSLLLVLLLVMACNKKEENTTLDKTLPVCIKTLTEGENGIKKVFLQMVDGEAHYWLNTDAMIIDGVELIVDESCEQVCILCGECILPVCNSDYEEEDWELIWEL